jgi:aryl-alcohol dehydrogenase-like predicted oxidoreductase
LTGTIANPADLGNADIRAQRYPRFAADAFEKNLVLVERVKVIAERRGLRAGELALAWVLSKGDDIVPIPGTKRRRFLEENAGAAEIALSPAEVAELEAAMPEDAVAGARYAPAGMKSVDQ